MEGVTAVASDAFRERMMAATKVVRGQENALRRRIAALYEECAKDMEQQILHYGEDSLTGRRAAELQKSMRGYVHNLWKSVEDMTTGAVYQGAALGIETQSSMLDDALHGVGLTTLPSFRGVFARTQDEAVASVINGTIYRGKHAGLSRRIWHNEALQAGNIEQLIAKAVAEGRSAPQLARDLEAYVNPKAAMPDHWNDIYEGLPFAYKVDYNAKRLAVTALNHAYYQGAIMAARENPFAEFLHWQLSSGHEIYDICDIYMEHDEGLGLGNFSLDNAPLPHPFCRCTWYIDCNMSLDEIGEELGRWIVGETNPKLDGAFAEWRGLAFGLDNKVELQYNTVESQPAPGRMLERPFSDGKMQRGDRFMYAGKEVTFEEWIGTAETIAGKGCKRKIDCIDYIVSECGGRPKDWKKRKCGAYAEVDGMQCKINIHWFENSDIHKYYGGKVKYDDKTGQWYHLV